MNPSLYLIKIFLLFWGVIIPLFGISQVNNGYFILTHDSIKVYHNEKIIRQSGDSVTGELVIAFGTMRKIISYADGWKTRYISYYSDMLKRSELNYKKGKLHGPSREWFENGKLKVEGYYSNDQKDSIWTYYYANGNIDAKGRYNPDSTCLVDSFIEEVSYTDYETLDGIIVTTENENHSCPDGEWKFYSPDGKSYRVIGFDKGVVNKMTFGSSDMQLILDGE